MRDSVATRRLPAWARWAVKIAVSPAARTNALHELRRRWRGEPGLPPGEIRHLLVICQGNICRSPFAEALLLRHGVTVRSAGLAARDGEPAEEAAVRAAHRVGIDLAQHATSKLRDSQVEWPDLILCMEGWQAKSVAAQWPSVRHKIRLLGDFLSELLFVFESRHSQVVDLEFVTLAESCLRVIGRLQQVDFERTEFDHEVKAITRHNLAIEGRPGRLESTIVLDI